MVVCGDGEYILYTAITLRNKSYGNAMEFVWSQDSSEYAIRDGNMVKIFKNFKEKKTFKPEAGAEGMIEICEGLKHIFLAVIQGFSVVICWVLNQIQV